MKVLITGATGFIGSHVVDRMLKIPGCEIIATAPDEEKAEQLGWPDRVTFIPFEIGVDRTDYDRFMAPDHIIHCAWYNYRAILSVEQITMNLSYQSTFLTDLVDQGLPSLTVIGSCFEFGKREGAIPDDAPADPTTMYGVAKEALREILNISCKNRCSFKWARVFYTYGPRQNEKTLFGSLEKAIRVGAKVFNMSEGLQGRDYLPVETVADYIVKIALQTEIEGSINCASGKRTTVLEVVKTVLEEKGVLMELNRGYYPYLAHEPDSAWAVVDKLEHILRIYE